MLLCSGTGMDLRRLRTRGHNGVAHTGRTLILKSATPRGGARTQRLPPIEAPSLALVPAAILDLVPAAATRHGMSVASRHVPTLPSNPVAPNVRASSAAGDGPKRLVACASIGHMASSISRTTMGLMPRTANGAHERDRPSGANPEGRSSAVPRSPRRSNRGAPSEPGASAAASPRAETLGAYRGGAMPGNRSAQERAVVAGR